MKIEASCQKKGKEEKKRQTHIKQITRELQGNNNYSPFSFQWIFFLEMLPFHINTSFFWHLAGIIWQRRIFSDGLLRYSDKSGKY